MTLDDDAPGRTSAHPVLWVMVAIMAGFEILFALVDAGLAPEGLGRWQVYPLLAFYDPLFEQVRTGGGVRPELVWSFVTHAFLHGGWLHLAINGAAFLGLGHAIVRTVGIAAFLFVFVVTAIVGALTFAVLADVDGPLVGASGAIFGFLAIITAWQERGLRLAGLSRAMIWRRIFGLVMINLVLAVGLGGWLAWEAHLGGWLAGWLLAGMLRPHGALWVPS